MAKVKMKYLFTTAILYNTKLIYEKSLANQYFESYLAEQKATRLKVQITGYCLFIVCLTTAFMLNGDECGVI